MFIAEGSEKDRALRRALPDYLERAGGKYRLKAARPMQPVIISWRPKKR